MTVIDRILTPFQKFEKIESFGGVLLFAAALIAVIWANSPFSGAYQALWQYEIGIKSDDFKLVKPLILWINDGLMAVFFFLIGLEIKRELLIGELNSVRKATLPILAAIGGMAFPVLLFILINQNPESLKGWGVPMATDIAFTLAILKSLGKRIPIGLKVFLTAFAIIDDIGAVLVIAFVYTEGIQWEPLLYAMLFLAVLFTLSSLKIYAKYILFLFGIAIWYFFLKSGIHPTVAGVLVAFAVPIRQRMDMPTFTENMRALVKRIDDARDLNRPILSEEQIQHIDDLETYTAKVQSPLQHLEHKLHDWVAYFIMPVFALANGGVIFSQGMSIEWGLVLAISVSLVFGNTIGVSLMSFLGIKLKLADLPEGVSFKQIIGVAVLAGVGFTMSLFIASLAFDGNPGAMDSAKLGILSGSLVSATIGYLLLRIYSK